MTKPGADNLISAVALAWGKELKIGNFNDRLVMQKGCFLLNEMGVAPGYNFSLYIRGPYSSDLADDYYEILGNKPISNDTSVDPKFIMNLSNIMSKGVNYLEAYSTLVLAHRYNPKLETDQLKHFVFTMKPALKKEIEEASESLFSQ
jgi:Uncharacterized conserved protein